MNAFELPIVKKYIGKLDEFVACWSSLYRYPDDHLYTDNIGKPLTPDRVNALYRWKNGGELSAAKQRSVDLHYHEAVGRGFTLTDGSSPAELLKPVGGGHVWGIFFLHCHDPVRFPIFDQHVHRAAQAIRSRSLAPLRARDTLKYYETDYLPLWATLDPGRFGRDLDKALWVFGKAISTPSRSDLNWQGLIRRTG